VLIIQSNVSNMWQHRVAAARGLPCGFPLPGLLQGCRASGRHGYETPFRHHPGVHRMLGTPTGPTSVELIIADSYLSIYLCLRIYI
jgi:hypothetical protein